MKAIKYLFVGALMSVFSVSAMAQATVDDAIKAIKSNSADKEQIVKAVVKANKKNGVALAQIGRAYFELKDTMNTKKYAEMADAASKHKCGEAFILLGDLAVMQDDGGKAAEWYQQAIFASPKNPLGYTKYANIYRGKSPDMAVEALEQMRTNCPDEPVDAYAGHIYYLSAKQNAAYMPKALAAFQKADRSRMDKNQLTEFALTAFASQQNELSMEVAKAGLQKESRSLGFNRLVLYNAVELKKFEDAILYVGKVFNESDSTNFTPMDYKYSALAYAGVKDYDKAIEYYQQQLEASDADAKLAVLKSLSDTYKAKDDYTNAIAKYKEYLALCKEATATDYAGLANLYRNSTATLDTDGQINAINQAVEVYKDMIQKFPTSADYSNFMAARTIQVLDQDQKKGLARPYYEALYTSIDAAGIKDNTDKTRIMEACQYLGIYWFKIKDDSKTARPYFDKLIQIDPENALAKQVLATY